MKRFGLIGKHLSHSFSPAYFREKFAREGVDAIYETYELDEITDFPALLSSHDLSGLNVTVPYKTAVLPYLDAIDPVAREIGAVNVICFRQGRTIGYNTDWIGFRDTLQPFLPKEPVQALVFGSGGSSKAVRYALHQLGIPITLVSRNTPGLLSYETLSDPQAASHRLWVNTTPVGMFPHTEACLPLPFEAITPEHMVVDLIYNPEKTRLLEAAENRGARIRNGLDMLHKQAEAAWQLWENY